MPDREQLESPDFGKECQFKDKSLGMGCNGTTSICQHGCIYIYIFLFLKSGKWELSVKT